MPVYSQIDFILCRRRSKPLLRDARSYAGALTYSDHRIVISRVGFHNIHLCFKPKKQTVIKYDLSRLTSNKDIQTEYRDSLDERLRDAVPPIDPNDDLTSLLTSVTDAAKESVGLLQKNKHSNYLIDDALQELVKQRHALRLQLNTNKAADRTALRREINKKKNQIQKRLGVLRSAVADQLYSDIANTDESRRMFQAVRNLNYLKSNKPIGVHDANGCLIGTDQGKASVIREYLEKQFSGNESPLQPFDGPPRPLNRPFTADEIKTATKSLKNGRANGPDGVPNELLKYSSSSFHIRYAGILNKSFETNTYLEPIGQATITPLQKPKKPVGPLKSLRPLTLSNAARKILSMATLKRIEQKVDKFTGPWQCAYKQARSCADIVWCQRRSGSIIAWALTCLVRLTLYAAPPSLNSW